MAKNTVNQIDKYTGKQDDQCTTNIINVLLISRTGCPCMTDHSLNNLVHSYPLKNDLMIQGMVAIKARARRK